MLFQDVLLAIAPSDEFKKNSRNVQDLFKKYSRFIQVSIFFRLI